MKRNLTTCCSSERFFDVRFSGGRPSRWLGWLKPGYAFQVHIEETDKTYPAEITRVGGRVDPVSQTIKVFGKIRGDAADLMAGMSGRANIPPPK